MRGAVFKQFLDYAAGIWGDEMVDEILADCHLENPRAADTICFYDHEEIAALAHALGQRTGELPDTIVSGFGRHLARKVARLFPIFLMERQSLLALDARLDTPVNKNDASPAPVEPGSSIETLAMSLMAGIADQLKGSRGAAQVLPTDTDDGPLPPVLQ